MNLRHPSLVPSILSPPDDSISQNPDSSSEKVDVTEIEDEKPSKEKDKEADLEKEANKKNSGEGVNLSIKGRKAAVTLIRQREEINKEGAKGGRSSGVRNSDVWRPY